MELPRLRYFLATADELSFRRAADVIGVNQSAVSRQVAALEDELGVTLFERRSTGARLTKVGRVFLADARRIVADFDRARETITAVAFGTEGRLRLAVCEDATTPTFAAIFAAHRDRCPAVTLDLFEIPSAMQPAALRRGEIDAGLLLPPVRGDGIQLDELWQEKWLVSMPSDHRFAVMESISVSDLAGEDFITAIPSSALNVTPKVRRCSSRRAFSRVSLRARFAG